MMDDLAWIEVDGSLEHAVRNLISRLGGLDRFVKQGESVFLKPNFNSADPFPASTDVVFLRIVIQLLLEVNPGRIVIGESSAIGSSTQKNLEKVGLYELGRLSPLVEIVNLDKEPWVETRIPKGRNLKRVRVPRLLGEVDRLVLLPCLKTHFLAQFSGSLKLSVAFMKPLERIALHLRHLQEKIAELNKIIDPDLVLMDARKCLISGGPYKGEVREPGIILGGRDRIALDLEGIRIIQGYDGNSLAGIAPEEIEHIRLAIEYGLGKGSQVGIASPDPALMPAE